MALGKSAGSSSFRMSMDVPYRSCHSAGMQHMGGTPKFPRYQVSMMVCKNLVVGKAVCFGRSLPGISQLTEMGGHAGSRRRAVIGLDLRPGPIQRKCGQACNLVV
jgi:hypothetical protein